MIIDTHAHYDDEVYDKDRDKVLEESLAAGVGMIVNSTAEIGSVPVIMQMTRDYDFIRATVGIHPHYASDIRDEHIEELKQAVTEDRNAAGPAQILAIGEIGLDYHYPDMDKAAQKKWFEAQIALAKELSLPIVVHSRDAAADTLDILRSTDAGANGGDMHCYSYSKETARELLDLNFCFGIGGVLTFKNAKKLKEVVDYVPLENLLLETDAPYLTPEPDRGKRNSSAYLPRVVTEIARIKGVSEEKVIEVTEANTRRLFRIED